MLHVVKDDDVFIWVNENSITFSQAVEFQTTALYRHVKRLSHDEFFVGDNSKNVKVEYDEAKKKIYVETYMHDMHMYNYFDTITQAWELIEKLASAEFE